MEEVEKEDKKKVVVSGAATGEEDAFPKVFFYFKFRLRRTTFSTDESRS